MKTNKAKNWLKEEKFKDHEEILQHKKNVIAEIKKSGLNEYLKSQKKEVEPDSQKKDKVSTKKSIWKKIKKTLKF